MRRVGASCLAALLLGLVTSAHAAEKGLIIRAGDIMAQPFIDAAKTGAVKPSQPVTIVERRGGWVNVDANGTRGWVRLLNVRLEPAGGVSTGKKKGGGNPLSLITGSSKRTVTTGIKGMNEEDIRNATANYAELANLGRLAVEPSEARANAARNKLKEEKIDYLKNQKGSSK